MYLIRYMLWVVLKRWRNGQGIMSIWENGQCLAFRMTAGGVIWLCLWAGDAKELLVFESEGNEFPSPHASTVDGEDARTFHHS